MRNLYLMITGLGVLAIGLAKTFVHLNSPEMLQVPGCLGSTYLIPLSNAHPAIGHCWGCYVALAGAAMIVLSIANQRFAGNRADPGAGKGPTLV
jgi:hypothetical protein